jgi:hypothetical protein
MPFLHNCHCGEWGAFGYGDQWYCARHRPDAPTAPYVPDMPAPPVTETSPGICVHCGGRDGIILPVGIGPHAWVHDTCLTAWRAERRKG